MPKQILQSGMTANNFVANPKTAQNLYIYRFRGQICGKLHPISPTCHPSLSVAVDSAQLRSSPEHHRGYARACPVGVRCK
jgi:hypothetical protein